MKSSNGAETEVGSFNWSGFADTETTTQTVSGVTGRWTACINDNVGCPRPGDRISASVEVTPGGSGENNYTLALTDNTTPGNNFSVTQPCATDTCLDSSAEWIIERPAFSLPFGFQILPSWDAPF